MDVQKKRNEQIGCFDLLPATLFRVSQCVGKQGPERIRNLHSAAEVVPLAEFSFKRKQDDLWIQVEALHNLVEKRPLYLGDRYKQVLWCDLVMIARLGFIICLANQPAPALSDLVGVDFEVDHSFTSHSGECRGTRHSGVVG